MSDKPPRPTAPDKVSDTHGPAGEATGDMPASGAPAPARPDAPSDTDVLPQLGDYVVVRKLGEGGMGAVYLAEDSKLKRRVAVKTMRPEVAAEPASRDRFEREARAAAAVEHDNIVPILHIGDAADGTPFIVMPFLQGEMLDARLKREPVSPPDLILKVAGEVAEGLAAAHARGLIHRDIKPANVWLEGDPKAADASKRVRRSKILDFGLARSVDKEDAHITATGAVLGTPAYMAPEQARGERVDHRADLWSLGVMLYRMAAGRPPFRGPNAVAVLIALATETPPPVGALAPDLPPALADLIDRLMQKDACARPQTAAEVADAVRRIAQDVRAPSQHSVPVVVMPAPAPAPEVNPWEEATETDAEEDERPIARTPVARDEPTRGRLPWLIGGVLAGLLALAVLAAVVIRFETAEGTLVVELDDPDVVAKFKNGALILCGPDGTEKYRLSPGERDKKLPAGPYTIKVEGADGLSLTTTAFTLKKGDKVTVRVTHERKPAPPPPPAPPPKKDAPKAPPPASEFRELHGATQAELEAWMKKLQDDGYIPSYLSAEAGTEVRFNAVAVLNPNKTPWRFIPRNEYGTAEAWRSWREQVDAGFHQALIASHAGDNQFDTHVWSRIEGVPNAGWSGRREFILDKLKDVRAKKQRPFFLAPGAHKDGGERFVFVFGRGDGRDWDAQLELTAEELVDYVAGLRKRAWRLDWLAARRIGDKVKFQAIAVEDPDKTPWDFQMGLTAAQYEAQLTARRAAGLRPLAVVGYADGGQTRYAVVWRGDDGFTPLFNGKDLSGWTTQVGGVSNWKVEDGAITCTGPRDHLFTTRSDFTDFHLRAEVKVNAAGNSGIFFRSGMPTVPGTDYEAQIALAGDPQRTGSLYHLVKIGDNRVKADEWFKYEIIAEGNRVRLLLDGNEVVNYTDERPTRRTAGRIALQHNNPQTAVHFRKIEVKELKAGLAADRKAAEWVLSAGGIVRVNGEGRDIRIPADLPREPFRLTWVYLANNRPTTDDGLAVFAECEHVVTLDLWNTKATDAGLAHFKNCKGLKELLVGRTGLTDAGLALFKDCADLELLHLVGTRIDGSGLVNFRGHKKLKTLWLRETPVTDANLVHLKDCSELAVLELGDSQIGDAGLAHFANCKKVTGLHLSSCLVTDAGLAHFKDCADLTDLGVHFTRVGDAGLAHLANCKNLQRVWAHNSGVTDKGLDHLFDNRDLRMVTVRAAPVTAVGVQKLAKARPRCLIEWDGGTLPPDLAADRAAAEWVLSRGGVVRVNGAKQDIRVAVQLPKEPFRLTVVSALREPTDADLVRFANCASLADLDLGFAPVTDAGMAHLGELTALRRLSLGHTRITDAGVAHLKNLTNLTELVVGTTGVTDDGVAQIAANFNRLAILDLGGAKVSDAGLTHLKSLKQLATLHLYKTAVTDDGLAHLTDISSLRRLSLHATKVTEKGVAALAKALPNCKIEWNGAIDPKAGANLDADRAAAEYVASVGGGVRIDGTEYEVPKSAWPARPFRLTAVMLHGNQKITGASLAALRGCRDISIAWLNNSRVTDDALAHLSDSTGLTELHLHGTAVTDAGLAHFKGHRDLRHVNLGHSRVTGAALAHLKDCANLRILQVYGLPVTDDDLAVCAGFPQLTELWVEDTRTTDALLNALENCPNLKKLDANGTGLTDDGLERLRAFPKLANVHAKRTKVTAAKVEALAKAVPRCRVEWDGGVVATGMEPDRAAAERVLALGGGVWLDDGSTEVRAAAGLPKHPFRLTRVQLAGAANVTAADLAKLRACPDLTGLDLSRASFDDAALAGAAGWTALTHLNLSATPVTDAGLAHFKGCTKLLFLGLWQTKVTDTGLAHFAGVTELRQLMLSGTGVTDTGLAYFKGCERMTNVALFNTAVTDAGLAHARGWPRLMSLSLQKTNVTAQGVAELQNALPDCRIGWDGNPDAKK